jgi:hypothetical protein
LRGTTVVREETEAMGFLDKAKMAAEQATTKAKEGIGEVQTRRELGQAYDELGKLTFDLADSGEITNDQVGEIVEKIRGLKAELESS